MQNQFIRQEGARVSRGLSDFIVESPTAFHTVSAISRRLDAAGFEFLAEGEAWHMQPGGSYYTVRNQSSVVALNVGCQLECPRFIVAASHDDSPTYKLKHESELVGPGDYLRLNVEGYGGMIDRTWLDRPLTLAGRVYVREDKGLACRLFYADEDALLIPSLAVHMNREVNAKGEINRQRDMCPLFLAGDAREGAFKEFLAERLGVAPKDICAHDLVLVNRQRPCVWGAHQEFLSAPRLDDLQCAYSTLEAFLQAQNDHAITVYACFNNEEVGSSSMQGALSTLLPDVLRRTCAALGHEGEDAYVRAVAQSFVASCDNAHAVDPHNPELFDEGNRAWLNKGPVVKEAANQRYTTDAVSRALFEEVCRRAEVPTQVFANRSDKIGGSTLGNLLTHQVSAHMVDVGLPQLAMHSAYETAGVCDTWYMVRAMQTLYETEFAFLDDGSVALA